MSTSLISGNNPAYLFAGQSIMQKLYSPLISGGLDYIYSMQIDKLNSANSRTLAMYGAITTLATSVINDTVLLQLTTGNNMYVISQGWTQKLMGPILNGFLYLWMVRNFKSNLAYYNESEFKTMLKATLIYLVSDNLADYWISMQTA